MQIGIGELKPDQSLLDWVRERIEVYKTTIPVSDSRTVSEARPYKLGPYDGFAVDVDEPRVDVPKLLLYIAPSPQTAYEIVLGPTYSTSFEGGLAFLSTLVINEPAP